MPVLLVGGPDEVEVDRKGRVPVGHPVGIGDARELGRQGGVGPEPGHRQGAGDVELGATGRQLVAGADLVIAHPQPLARCRLQLLGGPAVEMDGWRPGRLRPAAVAALHGPAAELRRHRQPQRGDRGVGQQPLADLHPVGQVGEQRQRRPALLRGQLERRLGHRRAEHELAALEGQPAVAGNQP